MWGQVTLGWVLCLLCGPATAQSLSGTPSWSTYGGDAGGQRYSTADQVTPANVAGLHVAWEFHTGALATKRPSRTEAAFEATPILADRTLYLATPFDQVIALDATSGQERWRYDPNVPEDFLAGVYTSRGVAFWHEPHPSATCDERVFAATLEAG